MIRSRVLLSATLLTLYSATAFGFGMGKLELNSALNQVFSAEIQLINIGRLQPEEIIPSLATQDDFNRYGVERIYICLLYTSPSPRDQRGSRMAAYA